ncbi:MAG TPA: 50S ribosomal protein L6 [Candidatus Nitrosopolaris sp.]|nr:50S ribosomal protein L6 [Candidatus Nitrosopolaris sp.]
MVTSSEDIKAEIQIPENVKAEILDNIISVEGRLGKLKKNVMRIPVAVRVQDNKFVIRPYGKRKKDLAITNTVRSIIRNMLTGVEKGFTYRLKIVSAHFPISVKLRGEKVSVENYFGERSPRTSRIVGEDTKVTIVGDDILVQGPSLEDVSQTAANIELSTKMKGKDQRVFLDGLYIYSKERGI